MAYEDLLKDVSEISKDDKNYFTLTITDLDVSKAYPIQLRWKYNDGTFGQWSTVKALQTPGESTPNTPSTLTVSGGSGFITITWDGKDNLGQLLTNYKQIDVYIDGSPFDGTKPADNFTSAGTKTIAAPAGTYLISSYAVSTIGSNSLLSQPVQATVTSASQPIADPEDPFAPTITSGLASIIVEWNGKRSDGNDFTSGSFAGAKIFIGKTSTFIPSEDNWVHTLNFANGANKVSIGVGTIINKDSGEELEYNTPYYVKLDTINSAGTSNNNPISATNNPITVSKLPASEISTGILTADNSITAGVEDGQRVVISGSASPFVIYGTDGTTKLLEYITSGNTGLLSIKGSGTFTGDISAATGTLTNALNIGTPVSNVYPFSVSSSGYMVANSGHIGGWYLADTYLYNESGTFQIDSSNSRIAVGSTSGTHIRISASGGIATYNGGTQTNGFNLSTSGTLSLSGTVSASDIYVGALNSSQYLMSDGSFRLGGSSTYISGNSSTIDLNISGATASTGGIKIANIDSLYDGDSAYGDTTLAVSRTNGYVVRGRAFFYGGNYWPQTPDGSANQSSFLAYAKPGDIWMSRLA